MRAGSRAQVAVALAAPFLSGAAGLVHEIAWFRRASLVFGSATCAFGVVLAVFFLGLALGSQVFGRISARSTRPLLGFAALELGVSVAALASLPAFDLLVVPSLWPENHPLVVADAFRRGLPVLASDLGALREHVQEGRGGLRFPAGDAAALAAHLRRLAGDRAELARLAAAAPAVPGVEEHAEIVEHLYARCVAELGR